MERKNKGVAKLKVRGDCSPSRKKMAATCEEISSRQNTVKNMKLEKIIGAYRTKEGVLKLIVEWKGCQDKAAGYVLASEMNKKYTQEVIAFYESRINWKTLPKTESVLKIPHKIKKNSVHTKTKKKTLKKSKINLDKSLSKIPTRSQTNLILRTNSSALRRSSCIVRKTNLSAKRLTIIKSCNKISRNEAADNNTSSLEPKDSPTRVIRKTNSSMKKLTRAKTNISNKASENMSSLKRKYVRQTVSSTKKQLPSTSAKVTTPTRIILTTETRNEILTQKKHKISRTSISNLTKSKKNETTESSSNMPTVLMECSGVTVTKPISNHCPNATDAKTSDQRPTKDNSPKMPIIVDVFSLNPNACLHEKRQLPDFSSELTIIYNGVNLTGIEVSPIPNHWTTSPNSTALAVDSLKTLRDITISNLPTTTNVEPILDLYPDVEMLEVANVTPELEIVQPEKICSSEITNAPKLQFAPAKEAASSTESLLCSRYDVEMLELEPPELEIAEPEKICRPEITNAPKLQFAPVKEAAPLTALDPSPREDMEILELELPELEIAEPENICRPEITNAPKLQFATVKEAAPLTALDQSPREDGKDKTSDVENIPSVETEKIPSCGSVEGTNPDENQRSSLVSTDATKEVLYKKWSYYKIKFYCGSCDESFTYKSELEVHELSHLNQPKRSRKSRSSLNDSLVEYESSFKQINNSTKFSLKDLSYSFKKDQSQSPSNNKKFCKHSNPLYSCKLCKSFINATPFKKTNKKTRGSLKSQKCDLCQKSFKSRNDLFKHAAEHSDADRCRICMKRFPLKKTLAAHFDNSSKLNTDFTCETCETELNNKKLLSANDPAVETKLGTTSSETQKPNSLQCAVCLRHFRIEENLIRHTRIHTTVQLFKCTICPKIYTNEGDFNNHVNRMLHKQNTTLCKGCGNSIKVLRSTVQINVGTGVLESISKPSNSNQARSASNNPVPEIKDVNETYCKSCIKIKKATFKENKTMRSGVSLLKRNISSCNSPFNERSPTTYKRLEKFPVNDSLRGLAGSNSLNCTACGNDFKDKVLLDSHVCIPSSVDKPKEFDDLTQSNVDNGGLTVTQ